MTGVDAPYEPCNATDLRVNASDEPPEATASRIFELLVVALSPESWSAGART